MVKVTKTFLQCVVHLKQHTVFKNSMTTSTAGEKPESAPNSDSSMRSRSSWSPV